MHIRTVSGDIAPEELGFMPGHEPLLIDLRGLWDEPRIETPKRLLTFMD